MEKGRIKVSDLRSPLEIKSLKLNNRLVMPPMALDIASENGGVTERMIQHYTSRAALDCDEEYSKGLGLIILEHSYVRKDGKVHPRQLGVYDDQCITGLTQLAQSIHQAGVPAGLQLSHAGARGLEESVGPSSIPVPFLKRFKRAGEAYGSESQESTPRQLDKEEIFRIAAAFARGAERAKAAGFDLVEIHGAHGYLLNQFFSPLTNQRKDEYGGSLINRLRFPLEVLEAVRAAVGSDYPVFYRLGADDRMAGGNEIADGIEAAKLLEKTGADCLDLSGGLGGYIQKGPEGFFCYMADAIKPHVTVPILLTGGIKTGAFANRLVSQGHADLVGVGRAILADPNWVSQAWAQCQG